MTTTYNDPRRFSDLRKILMIVLNTIELVAMAGVAFAAPEASVVTNLIMSTAFSMAAVAIGCGFAQSLGLKAACEGTARNPEAGNKIQITLILGMAFIESLAIYALVVNLILLFANPVLK